LQHPELPVCRNVWGDNFPGGIFLSSGTAVPLLVVHGQWRWRVRRGLRPGGRSPP